MDQRTAFSSSNSNFDARAEGLFATDAEGNETRICDAIWHIGNAGRADGSDAADIVVFLDCTGSSKEVILPRKDFAVNTTRMFEKLASHNFDVPQSSTSRRQLVSYLAECRRSPKRTFLLVQRMGWHNDSFVIGKDVIAADATVGIRLDGPLRQVTEKFGQGGTLEIYQQKVLGRAKYSSRLMTGVALALLAPLARIISIENGGINVAGAAGIGKTTILRVIGSVYGGGPQDYFQTWLMTDNAPATLGFTHCDLPLLLDETATLDPDPKKAADRLVSLVHRLSSGQEKAQSHRALGEERGLTDFHVIFASTSEHRLSDFLYEGARKATGGVAARFVDIPADASKGFKIFERLPRHRKTGKPIKVDRYLQRINRDCRKYYGVAGRCYLRRLVDELKSDPKALKSFLEGQMAAFEKEVANDPHVDPRVRRRFAALYAAGRLGLRYGIVPPESDRFMDAIRTCYRDAVALMPRLSLSTGEVADTLGRFFDDNWKGLLKPEGLTERAFEAAVGVRPDKGRHGNRVWLKTSAFLEIFPGDYDGTVKRLVAAGVIVTSRRGLIAHQQRVPGLKKKPYFYVIDRTKLDAARQKPEDRDNAAPRH